MNTLFFVNQKTRMCQALSGPPNGADHLSSIVQAKKDGFLQVTGDELDAFCEVTAKAKSDGWNPNRMCYDTWLKKRGGTANAAS